MLAIFPSLQPEELLCSAVARYADVMAFPHPDKVLREVFGLSPGEPEAELPVSLEHFLAALPPGHGLTWHKVLAKHTAFPYYRAFLPPAPARAMENAMWYHGSEPYALANYEYPAKWTVRRPERLRYCHACVDEDRRGPAGVAYWRRVHQLAGVLVCPTHHIPLTETRLPRDGRGYRSRYLPRDTPAFVSLERARSLSSEQQIVPPAAASIAQAVAEDTLWLLQHQVNLPSLRELYRRHRGALAQRGLTRPCGRLKWEHFHKEISRFYPDDVLRALGVAAFEGEHKRGADWLSSLWDFPLKTFPPLCHILLIRFSGLSAEQFFTQRPTLPSSRRPTLDGPCGNPACARYDPPVPRAVPAERSAGAPYVTISCPECGYAYGQRADGPGRRCTIQRVGSLWEERLRVLAADPEAKLPEVARTLGVHPDRLQRHAADLGCWNPSWGPAPKPRGSGKRAQAVRQRLKEEKERVLRLKAVPKYSRHLRRTLADRFPLTLRFLRRVDPAWLDAKAPPEPPRPRARRPPPYFGSPTPDECALTWARGLAALVRAWPGRPVQIRPRTVLRQIGWWVFDAYDHIPQTRAYLAEVAEPAAAFAERRIVWAARWFATRREVPTLEQLAEAATLSGRLRKTHRTGLQRALQALQAHADGGVPLPAEWGTPLPESPLEERYRWWPEGQMDSGPDFRYFFGSPSTPFPEASPMARPRSGPADDDRRRMQGYGEGHGRSYKPWITVRSFGSRGMSHRVPSATAGRSHDLFSNGEYGCFLLLDWSSLVTDIREQFPLHPVQETREIAASLGYAHPRRGRKVKGEWIQEDGVMTSDFRVEFVDGVGVAEVVISVKPLGELTDERTLEKLHVERRYWARRGIPWFLVTEEELPQDLIANLSFLAPFRSVDGYGVDAAELPEVLAYLFDKLAASPSVAPGKVCAMADERLHFKHGVCLALVWHAIATKQWWVDLHEKLDPGAPLQGLTSGSADPELRARTA